MSEPPQHDLRPWSARRPQSIVISAVLIVLAGALVRQGISSIGEGVGGLVPYLIIIGGPVLAAYYVWYLNIRRFDDDTR